MAVSPEGSLVSPSGDSVASLACAVALAYRRRMATAPAAPTAAAAAPTPSSHLQSSSLQTPPLRALGGWTRRAVVRRAEETLGATVSVTASAASSRTGAAHSRAP